MYQQALDTLPRKYWIGTQNHKVQIRIKVQSKEKLIKDLEKLMSTYEHLISAIDSMAEVHHIPSLGALGEEKTWEEIAKYIQEFLEPIRKVVASQDLSASQENLVQFIMTPVRIYTKISSLSNQIMIKRDTLIPNAVEYLHRLREDTPQVSPVAMDYQAWQSYLKE